MVGGYSLSARQWPLEASVKPRDRVALPLDEYCNALRQKACRPAVEPLPGSADVAVESAALPSTMPADGPPRHASTGYRLVCHKTAESALRRYRFRGN